MISLGLLLVSLTLLAGALRLSSRHMTDWEIRRRLGIGGPR